MPQLTKDHIELLAQEVLRWPSNQKWKSKEKDRRFRSIFGATSHVVAVLWNRISSETKASTLGSRIPEKLFIL